MDDSFRLVEKRHDITSIINEAGPDVGGDLWQVSEDSQRVVYVISSVIVDFQNEKIIFHASENLVFNPLQTVFVRINHKSLVFKLMPGEFKIALTKLTAKFPKEARALDFRSEPRFVIRPKIYLSVIMRPALSHTLARIEGTIIDVSTNGIGLAINERFKHFVFRESLFVFLNIAGLELSGNLQGKVVNLPGRVWGIKAGEFKAGIKFSETITSEIYNHVMAKSK